MDMSTVEILCWVLFGIMAFALIICIIEQYKEQTIHRRMEKAIKKKDFYKFSRMLKKVFSRDDFRVECCFFRKLDRIYAGTLIIFDVDCILQELILDKSLFFKTLHIVQNAINTNNISNDYDREYLEECIKNIYVIDSDGNHCKVDIDNDNLKKIDSFAKISDDIYVALGQPMEWINN